ncbi:MAG: aminotransferase class V-fold PLP-dependent enzyme [Ilumatobacter sp.]|uniref:kynureninase n=1 Tax=Ilumatobacter sp. TaxID=1967498 RepID=UPI002632A3AB|nr:aminotransferase class V-fold PLP-dependent enzyme [Ilumatobacter sp.]MDJ0767981.1 aminotransferase class V-fold PLP-dependent enzyme [Ilumatobacter sp.]
MKHGEMLDWARRLDAGDPLGAWRERFQIPDPDLAYLDGNSLGMPPKRTLERVQTVIRDEWAGGLIRSWEDWLDLPQRVGDRLAPLIGAGAGEVTVHDSTTVNLYQLVVAAVRLRPDRSVIAIESKDFPTDRYVVDGIARARGLTVQEGFDDLGGVAVAVRSMIDYRSAEIVDLAAETARARRAGALVVWDLSHAAGLHPVGLHAAGAELAVGCTYKFLNGGPGAPGFSYVAGSLIEQLDQPIQGWFAQVDQFAMGSAFAPRPDIGRTLIGTPGIIGLAAAEEGIALTAEAGIDAIRAKSIALGRFALDWCDRLGLDTSTPRDDHRRGGHVCVHHPNARAVTARLATEHGVLADFREPDVIRLGCSPLTTRYGDVARALAAVDSMR